MGDTTLIPALSRELSGSANLTVKQDVSFELLTALIGPTDGPVAMSMRQKSKNNRCLTATTLRMRRHSNV